MRRLVLNCTLALQAFLLAHAGAAGQPAELYGAWKGKVHIEETRKAPGVAETGVAHYESDGAQIRGTVQTSEKRYRHTVETRVGYIGDSTCEVTEEHTYSASETYRGFISDSPRPGACSVMTQVAGQWGTGKRTSTHRAVVRSNCPDVPSQSYMDGPHAQDINGSSMGLVGEQAVGVLSANGTRCSGSYYRHYPAVAGGREREVKISWDLKKAPGIRITDADTGEVLSGKRTARTLPAGKQVALRVELDPPGGKGSLANIRWNIAGSAIKDYQPDINGARLERLGDADLRGRTIRFYWTSGGAASVAVEAKVDGVPHDALAQFEVQKPEVVLVRETSGPDFYCNWGTVRRDLNLGARIDVGAGRCVVVLADMAAVTPGIVVDAHVKFRPKYGGEVAWLQLAFANRELLFNGNPMEQPWRFATPGYVLDIDPADPASPPFSIPRSHAAGRAGETVHSIMQDSPYQTIGNDCPHVGTLALEVSDSFENYLMYRPKGKNSIWVPLLKTAWAWNGVARFDQDIGATGQWVRGDPASNWVEGGEGSFDLADPPVWTERTKMGVSPPTVCD